VGILQAEAAFFPDASSSWSADWIWGFLLILLTMLAHVLGLSLVRQWVDHTLAQIDRRRHLTVTSVAIVGGTTLAALILHAAEAGVWAFAYRFLGALPNYRSAMVYSLNAITSYGHTNLILEEHWLLMGALESLNGWLLFGITTACLFAVIERVWVIDSRLDRRGEPGKLRDDSMVR
jgi:hypothetical protein